VPLRSDIVAQAKGICVVAGQEIESDDAESRSLNGSR
jgi:hypothetical protein